MTILKTLNPAEHMRALAMLNSAARSDIELICKEGAADLSHIWIDITYVPDDATEQKMLADAIWWCRKTAQFIRHPKHHNLVRFIETKHDDAIELPDIIRQQGGA